MNKFFFEKRKYFIFLKFEETQTYELNSDMLE